MFLLVPSAFYFIYSWQTVTTLLYLVFHNITNLWRHKLVTSQTLFWCPCVSNVHVLDNCCKILEVTQTPPSSVCVTPCLLYMDYYRFMATEELISWCRFNLNLVQNCKTEDLLIKFKWQTLQTSWFMWYFDDYLNIHCDIVDITVATWFMTRFQKYLLNLFKYATENSNIWLHVLCEAQYHHSNQRKYQ